MMTTDTLIATIRADAEAARDADPQAVIMRLKQDLRAARQAATKARKYAEAMRDGADAALGNENVKLRGYLFEARRQRTNAQRALRDAQVSISDARAECARLSLLLASRPESASASPTIAQDGISDDDGPFPNIDPELVELRRLILALRNEDHETFAPAVCWALNNVKVITAGLKEATGNVRRKGRVAA